MIYREIAFLILFLPRITSNNSNAHIFKPEKYYFWPIIACKNSITLSQARKINIKSIPSGMLLCLELVVGIPLLRPLPWASAPGLSPASFRPASTIGCSTVSSRLPFQSARHAPCSTAHRAVSQRSRPTGSIPVRSTKITTEVPIWTPLLLLELVVGIEPTTCSFKHTIFESVGFSRAERL